MMDLPALLPAIPEIFLALSGLVLLLVGVLIWGPKEAGGTKMGIAVIVAFSVTLLLVLDRGNAHATAFYGMFQSDGYAVFMKTLILLGAIFALVLSLRYNEVQGISRFEYPVLVLFSTTGMLLMVSANDLLSLYIGFELQSLGLYVLAAFKRDTVKSSEAGLKYFVLGALSSGMLLFGISWIYGFTGSTNFGDIAKVLAGGGADSNFAIGVVVGLVFLSVGLAFKCSAVPFHMWTPDVYEGAPTSVTSFFAVAPKIAALALLVRVMVQPLGGLFHEWQQIIWVISAASMILGGYAAISQFNIKRMMAYSSIGHVGYALMGLAAGTEEGVRGVIIYLTTYLFMNLGAFAVILSMARKGTPVERIDDFAGLAKTRPGAAFVLALCLLSMAGIPPLAGIFGKVFVFMPAIHAGLYVLTTIGVLTSVLACYYYLRIVKVMYFDEAVQPVDTTAGRGEVLVMIMAAVLVTFFCIIPGPIMGAAGAAAATLFH